MGRDSGRKPLLYQLKVTLQHINPPIWRRIQVPADITLARLHEIIQIAMGWEHSHLHLFIVNGKEYGVTDPEFGATIRDERKAALSEIACEGDSFTYIYDFGDDWNHELLIEEALPAAAATHSPCCIGGERACPPEDCGGPFGYMRLLNILADPSHEDHEDMLEWVGGEPPDPESFDPAAVNRGLSHA